MDGKPGHPIALREQMLKSAAQPGTPMLDP